MLLGTLGDTLLGEEEVKTQLEQVKKHLELVKVLVDWVTVFNAVLSHNKFWNTNELSKWT